MAAGFLERGAERRAGLQQRPAHAELLRALTRKQERQLAGLALGFSERHRRMRAALAQRAQRFHRLRRIARRHRGPRAQTASGATPPSLTTADQSTSGMPRQPLAVPAGLRTQRRLVTAGHQQRDQRQRCRLCFPDRRDVRRADDAIRARRRLLQHDMRIRPAQSKRADACAPRPCRITRPSRQLIHHLDLQSFPVQMWIERSTMQRGRQRFRTRS